MLTMEITGLDKLSDAFDSLPSIVEGGVKVTGERSASFALVWEWGSSRISEPGPKTTWGINPDGERVVLTITAPYGYIRSNRQQYLAVLREEWGHFNIANLPMTEWAHSFKHMAEHVSYRCADIIRDAAPEDSGELKSDIVPVASDEGILQQEETAFDLSTQDVWG